MAERFVHGLGAGRSLVRSNGWTYGTGDSRNTNARCEWQGLSWSAGMSPGARVLETAGQ